MAIHIWRVRKDGGVYVPAEDRRRALYPGETAPAGDPTREEEAA